MPLCISPFITSRNFYYSNSYLMFFLYFFISSAPVTHTVGPMLARYWSTPALPNQPRANIGPIVCVTWVELVEQIIGTVFLKQSNRFDRVDQYLVEEYLELLITPEIRVLHLYSKGCICGKYQYLASLSKLWKPILDSRRRCENLVSLTCSKNPVIAG